MNEHGNGLRKVTDVSQDMEKLFRAHYSLSGRTVMLVGSELSAVTPLVLQLAMKGADVAVICRKPARISQVEVWESVTAQGGRIVFVEPGKLAELSVEDIVDLVESRLGPLDAYIDLSSVSLSDEAEGKGEFQRGPNWSLMQSVLAKTD